MTQRPHRPAQAAEVLRIICRGGTNKQVASLLSIFPSTVDHHVRGHL